MRDAACGLIMMSVFAGCCAPNTHASEASASFTSAWWCRGPNAQTIWASILRPIPSVPVHRERWDTPDGDFLDVDLLDAPPDRPILLVLHGLEGSSRAGSVRGLLQAAQREGWGGVALNFRGCSGEPNRLRRSYHGGETSDLAWVVECVAVQHPGDPILCVGISLGGNVLLKYVGERGDALPSQVAAVVAISAPVDLAVSARSFERGFFNRIYMARLVGSLKQKTLAKLSRYPDLVDRRKLSAVRTLGEFDDLVTASVHGFANAQDYWAKSSAKQFLPAIRRPTLLINAQDDPIFPNDALPRREVQANPMLTAEFPDAGGHVGFLDGWWPGSSHCWAEAEAIRFLKTHLSR